MYMTVSRSGVNNMSPLRVRWESNLTRLHGRLINSITTQTIQEVPGAKIMYLNCVDETNGFGGNEFGEDEIELQVRVDGATGWKTIYESSYNCNNDTDYRELDGLVTPIRFLEQVQVRVVEYDSADPNEESDPKTIVTLPKNHPGGLHSYIQKYPFGGGEYQFKFSLSHQIQTSP